MALKFGKTAGEIWAERFKAAFLTFGLLILDIVAMRGVVRLKQPAIGVALVIVLCYCVWQLISKVTTDDWFSIRVVLSVKTSRELFDDLFTCFLLINLATFIYVVVQF